MLLRIGYLLKVDTVRTAKLVCRRRWRFDGQAFNELREDGVGVVSVDPGDMRTQMHQQAFPGEDISDRPLPESTLPFWAWLLNQDVLSISGSRYQAQSERWEVEATA